MVRHGRDGGLKNQLVSFRPSQIIVRCVGMNTFSLLVVVIELRKIEMDIRDAVKGAALQTVSDLESDTVHGV